MLEVGKIHDLLLHTLKQETGESVLLSRVRFERRRKDPNGTKRTRLLSSFVRSACIFEEALFALV
jgi:hypothetical protein